jgi:hypothetical protein
VVVISAVAHRGCASVARASAVPEAVWKAERIVAVGANPVCGVGGKRTASCKRNGYPAPRRRRRRIRIRGVAQPARRLRGRTRRRDQAAINLCARCNRSRRFIEAAGSDRAPTRIVPGDRIYRIEVVRRVRPHGGIRIISQVRAISIRRRCHTALGVSRRYRNRVNCRGGGKRERATVNRAAGARRAAIKSVVNHRFRGAIGDCNCLSRGKGARGRRDSRRRRGQRGIGSQLDKQRHASFSLWILELRRFVQRKRAHSRKRHLLPTLPRSALRYLYRYGNDGDRGPRAPGIAVWLLLPEGESL